MAFDGITIANLIYDMNQKIQNGRISKIAQPEPDELLLTIKGTDGQYRLILSASASLPLVYFTNDNKPSPMTAPNFCMLLRKHIANGRILSITQPDFERIISFEIEHYNELGDLAQKKLIIEIMGKHSNIIFVDEQGRIIDSIKHVSASTSSVREVLPGRDYFVPKTQEKENPLLATKESFIALISKQPTTIQKAIVQSYTGISPTISNEICFRADLDADQVVSSLSEGFLLHLANQFLIVMEQINACDFHPVLITRQDEPIEYSAIKLNMYNDYEVEEPESISETLHLFYNRKERYTRIRQKSVDLRRIVTTALERNRKKYQLQLKQFEETTKKEQFKIFGELLHTYGYDYNGTDEKYKVLNYYTNEEIQIPMDNQLTALENAQKYFDKYTKLKRTAVAMESLLAETKQDVEHLESVVTALELAENEDDLIQIKEELVESGYIRKNHREKKVRINSRPLHYVTSDDFHIFVGKNNIQNDELTFKVANGGDWWFHAKNVPGSHVILKTQGREVPDHVFELAAGLAAYYSKSQKSPKVEIDYLERKNVKKPAGAKPGYVIYYTNYSMNVEPSVANLELQ